MNACRTEKGYRHWGHDIGPEDDPIAAGLGFCIAWDKRGVLGRDALLRAREAGTPKRRLVQLRLQDDGKLLYHEEPLWAEGRIVGSVTSGMYGHRVGAPLGMGYLRCKRRDPGLAGRAGVGGRGRTGACAGKRRGRHRGTTPATSASGANEDRMAEAPSRSAAGRDHAYGCLRLASRHRGRGRSVAIGPSVVRPTASSHPRGHLAEPPDPGRVRDGPPVGGRSSAGAGLSMPAGAERWPTLWSGWAEPVEPLPRRAVRPTPRVLAPRGQPRPRAHPRPLRTRLRHLPAPPSSPPATTLTRTSRSWPPAWSPPSPSPPGPTDRGPGIFAMNADAARGLGRRPKEHREAGLEPTA